LPGRTVNGSHIDALALLCLATPMPLACCCCLCGILHGQLNAYASTLRLIKFYAFSYAKNGSGK